MARIPRPTLRKPEPPPVKPEGAAPPDAPPPEATPPPQAPAPTATERMVEAGQTPAGAPLASASDAAAVLGRQTAPQPLGDPRTPYRNINLDRLDTPDGVDQVLDAVSIATQNAGYKPRNLATVREEAAAIDDRTMLGMLMKRKPGQTLNDAQLTKARQLMVASAENLQEWGRQLETRGRGGVSDLDLVEYQRALYRHIALQSSVQGATRDTARALNALKAVPDRLDPQAIFEAARLGGGPDAIFQKAVTIGRAKTVEEASKKAGSVGWLGRAAEKLVYYRTMSLLSGPRTHVVNAASNAVVNVLSMPERALAGVISQTVGSGQVFPQEVAEMFYGDVMNLTDALRLAGKAAKTGDSVFGGTKVESAGGAVESASKYGLPHDSPMATAYDYAASFVSAPGRALTAADEFYKTLAFNQQARALAYRVARQEGLTDGKAIGARIEEILAGPNQEKLLEKLGADGLTGDDLALEFAGRLSAEERTFQDIYRQSLDFARYQTFTDDIASDFGKGLASMHRASPTFRLIVPFYRTPANILSYAVERSPIFFTAPNFWRSVQAGGAKRDEAMARAVLGSAVAVWAISATMDGSLSGSGPPNPQLRKVYEKLGWKPYILGGPEGALSYQRMDPIATPLASIAEMADAYRYATSDKQREHILVVMTAALAEVMQDKTMLTGLSDLMDAMSAAQSGGSTNFLGRLAQSFVPYSSLLRTVTQEVDGVPRETQVGGPLENAAAYVRSTIPIPDFYEDLPPKLDFWGEPLQGQDYIGPDMVSPFFMARYKDDDATYALAQNGVAPSAVGCEFSVDGVAVDLHALDTGKGPGWACHEYRQAVGAERRKAVKSVIGAGEYRKAPIGGAQAAEGAFTRGDILSAALTQGMAAGRATFIERYRVQIEQAVLEGQANVRPVSPPPAFIEQGRERERQQRAGGVPRF
jgi:hypothetical protein